MDARLMYKQHYDFPFLVSSIIPIDRLKRKAAAQRKADNPNDIYIQYASSSWYVVALNANHYFVIIQRAVLICTAKSKERARCIVCWPASMVCNPASDGFWSIVIQLTLILCNSSERESYNPHFLDNEIALPDKYKIKINLSSYRVQYKYWLL